MERCAAFSPHVELERIIATVRPLLLVAMLFCITVGLAGVAGGISLRHELQALVAIGWVVIGTFLCIYGLRKLLLEVRYAWGGLKARARATFESGSDVHVIGPFVGDGRCMLNVQCKRRAPFHVSLVGPDYRRFRPLRPCLVGVGKGEPAFGVAFVTDSRSRWEVFVRFDRQYRGDAPAPQECTIEIRGRCTVTAFPAHGGAGKRQTSENGAGVVPP